MATIATITMNPAVDASTSIDHVVADRKLRCAPPRHEPGGGGINVARAIRELGGDCVAVYPVGGPTGDLLERLIEEAGLARRAVRVQGWTRENLTVLEKASGRQFRFGFPGATLEDAEWRACLDALRELDPPPDYIVASGSLPPGVPDDFYAQVARRAGQRGARLIVDTSGEPLRRAAEAGVFLLKPNHPEFSTLAGAELRDEAEQESAARELVKRGAAEVLVLSLGAAGALWVTAGESGRVRAPAVPIESRVGAGDSTLAGIVLALARGNSVREAVRFGVAAGTAAVMTPGTELCRRPDAERLYRRMTETDA